MTQIINNPIDKKAVSFSSLTGLIKFLDAAQKHQDNFNVLLSKSSREKFVADYNSSVSGTNYSDLAVTNFDIDKKLAQIFKLIYRSQNTRQHLVVMSLTDISSLSDENLVKYTKEMELRNIQLDRDEADLNTKLSEIYSGLGLSYNSHIFSMLLQLCGVRALTKREILEYVKDENNVDKLDANGNKIIAKYQKHITLGIGTEAQFKKAFFLHLLNLASAVELSESKEYIKMTEQQLNKLGIADYEAEIKRELEKLSDVEAAA